MKQMGRKANLEREGGRSRRIKYLGHKQVDMITYIYTHTYVCIHVCTYIHTHMFVIYIYINCIYKPIETE